MRSSYSGYQTAYQTKNLQQGCNLHLVPFAQLDGNTAKEDTTFRPVLVQYELEQPVTH